MKKGEVTAFLSMIFIVLVAFVGGVMESASLQMAKSYRRADMNRAMESVFAEYRTELLEEYDIFSLEATYETGEYGEEKLFDRLAYYGGSGMDQKLLRVRFLTDQQGQGFADQVSFYMKQKYGLDRIPDKLSLSNIWKKQDAKIPDYQREEAQVGEDLSSALAEAGGSLSEEGNPISYVGELKQTPLLELICPSGKELSQKSIETKELPSKRALNKGFGDFTDVSETGKDVTDVLFQEYLLEHFSCASADSKKPGKTGEKEGVLDYELEYLYAGKSSDRENLEACAKKILLLRFVSNYGFLRGSSAKRAEAEALALTLCTVAAVPAAERLAAEAILLSWAYGESIVDLRSLLAGGKVPLTKSEGTWQLSLSGLLKLKESGSVNDGASAATGNSYQDYLRILLFLRKQGSLRMRALDLIEKNIRTVDGRSFFRVDHCLCQMEVESTCRMRRGVNYSFRTYFGYR